MEKMINEHFHNLELFRNCRNLRITSQNPKKGTMRNDVQVSFFFIFFSVRLELI